MKKTQEFIEDITTWLEKQKTAQNPLGGMDTALNKITKASAQIEKLKSDLATKKADYKVLIEEAELAFKLAKKDIKAAKKAKESEIKDQKPVKP